MIERTVHDVYSGKTKCPECGGGELLYFEQPALERVWLECQGCGCRFDPEEYGEIGGVKLTGEIEKLAKRLAGEYMKTSPPHRPENVLPACHYLACVAKGKRMTQREIARISGTSTVTIRKVWKDVVKRVRTIGDRDYDELFGG